MIDEDESWDLLGDEIQDPYDYVMADPDGLRGTGFIEDIFGYMDRLFLDIFS